MKNVNINELLDLIRFKESRKDIILKFEKFIVEEYVDEDNPNSKKLKAIFETDLEEIAEELAKLYRPCNFPFEVIVIPAIKFTKKPLVDWKSLQVKDPLDVEVMEMRRICCKLGIMVNHLYMTKGFVHIDLDFEDPSLKAKYREKLSKLFDIETRRGFHKVFYLPNMEGAVFKYKRKERCEEDESKCYVHVFRTTIHIPEVNAKLDIKSTRRYLAMFPEHSHYLIVENERLYARKYRCLNNACMQFAYSTSVELLKAKVDEIKQFIINVLSIFNDQLAKSVEGMLFIETIDKNRYAELEKIVGNEKILEDRSITSPYISFLKFDQLINILKRHINELPNCIKAGLFSRVEKGYCYGVARILASILSHLVYPSLEEVEKIAEYCAERFESFKKPRTYYWLYFMFSKKPREGELGRPSLYGVEKDTYMLVVDYIECEKCRYKDICAYYNHYVLNRETGMTPRMIMINLVSNWTR